MKRGEAMNTVKEVAEIFKVTTRTVQSWIANGKIKSIKIGGVVRISSDEIERIKKGE